MGASKQDISKETRLDAYLTRPVTRKREIIKVLKKEQRPMGAREIAYLLGYKERNAAAPRLHELEREGIVEKVGKVWDPITQRTVTGYAVTKGLER